MIDLFGWGLFDMPKVKDMLMPILSINGDNYPEVLALSENTWFDSLSNSLDSYADPGPDGGRQRPLDV